MAELKHAFAFDPTYGYDRDALLAVPAPPEPEGYVAFWRETYERARATKLDIAQREIASARPELRVFEVEYNSLGGVRIGGWITLPRDGEFARGVVVGHGYGGREGPDLTLPGPPAAAIFPCARGFHRSQNPAIPNTSDKHVLCGIESKETYVHRGCVADLWCAASALIELYPQVASRLHYMGSSFGGGTGAMAMPWEPRFCRAFLEVPSFGNHPLRVTLPCVGSGESVRQLYLKHPRPKELLDVLAFFDSAIHARHIRIPTYCAVAAFDPAVPPPGQFAVYNAIGAEKKLFVRKAAHFDYPDGAADNDATWRGLCEWFEDGE